MKARPHAASALPVALGRGVMELKVPSDGDVLTGIPCVEAVSCSRTQAAIQWFSCSSYVSILVLLVNIPGHHGRKSTGWEACWSR